MADWTAEQREAIMARNHTILVSAAAGSGKTAVLVERIVSLIREGARLDRMLIVTFTRAAAAEMRDRLRQRLTDALQEEPDLFGQALEQMDMTIISTIHTFCKAVLQQDFSLLGIDPSVRVCEEYIARQLKEQALDETINRLVEEEDPEFRQLYRDFSLDEIRKMAPQLHTFLMSMPEPFNWLRRYVNLPAAEEHPVWDAMLERQVKLLVAGAKEQFVSCERMLAETYAISSIEKTIRADRMLIEGLVEASEHGISGVRSYLQGLKFATAARMSPESDEEEAWKARFGKQRDALKDIVQKQLLPLCEERAAGRAELEKVSVSLRGLEKVTRGMYDRYQELKNRQRFVDFNDLEQMTMKVLQDERCRREWQNAFDHIFVDECQDVSRVQDAIIQQLHGEKNILFMVGDVKQSIYRFRQADPTLFLDRLRSWSDDRGAEERRILLQKNFRSTKTILDAANRVFRGIMREEVTELNYLPEDELIPGKDTLGDAPVEMLLMNLSKTDKQDRLLSEAKIITKRINSLLKEEYGDRNYRYSDMVILMSKQAGVGQKLAETLQNLGVPVFFDGPGTYYETSEVIAFKALLSLLDNPLQDVPLTAVLKLPCFAFDDNDLARIRLYDPTSGRAFWQAWQAALAHPETEMGARCVQVHEQLEEWRFYKENMRLSDFLWYLLRDSGYYACCGVGDEGDMRQANLRILTEKAASFEDNGDGTLSGFLELLALEKLGADSQGAHVLGEKDNVVRIMTMHKSKGLQFPVVFLMHLEDALQNKAMHGPLRTHPRMGLLLPYTDAEKHIRRYPDVEKQFAFAKKLDELAERCRLLYVAMTRAQDRLIMTGIRTDETTPPCWGMSPGPWRVWKADAMLDWVMQTLTDERITGGMDTLKTPWQVTTESDTGDIEEASAADEVRMDTLIEAVSRGQAEMPSRWIREERKEHKPLKTSVTGLSHLLNVPDPDGDTDETPQDKRMNLMDLPEVPSFLKEEHLTGAQRGTLMHRFLGLVNLKALEGNALDGIQGEISRMEEAGIYQPSEIGTLNPYKLRAWFVSALGQRMMRSSEVHREWGFNLVLDETQNTLLQGIIDCVFLEDDAWVLVDYKTDRIEDEDAFVDRHRHQLSWYALALEKITGRLVRECWLWSIGLEKAFAVSRETVGELHW